MSNEYEPIVEQWYEHQDKGGQFQVTAIDDVAGTVEIQYFDGDLEEIDLDSWADLDIELIEAPEDWTGPVDNIELDELEAGDIDMSENE